MSSSQVDPKSCLTALDKYNSIMAKAASLIFCYLTSPQPKRYLLAYCCTYNAFFMNLAVSFFVSFHLSSQRRVSILCLSITKIVRNFNSGCVYWFQRFFSNSCWFILLHIKWVEYSLQWSILGTSLFRWYNCNWGASPFVLM